MTAPDGGPPPTTAAGYWAGRTSTDTETPGPCRLDPDRVAAARAWLGEFYGDGAGAVRLGLLTAGKPWDELRPGFRAGRGPFLDTDHTTMLDALARSVVACADGGHDVFACPYLHETGRSKGGAVARRHLHADIDGGGLDAERLARVRAVGGLLVASGSVADDGVTPRGHVYVRLAESVPVHAHEALCHALGQMIGGADHDTGKTTDENMLRPAGTLNHKPENGPDPRPVRWLIGPDDDAVRTWEPEMLARVLGLSWPVPEPADDPAPVVAAADAEAGDRTPPAVGSTARRLDGLVRSVREASAGLGNDRLNKCAGLAAALCATEPDAPPADEVRAGLVAAFLSRPIPPGQSARSRELEARGTVASGWRWGSTHPTEALADRRDLTSHHDETTDDESPEATRSTPYRDLSALVATGRMPERPLPEFLTRADTRLSLFYRGRVNRLFGKPENGKTWVIIAAGSDLLRSESGRYAHVDLDHMGDDVVRRLALLGVPWEMIGDPERFRLYEPGDRGELAEAVADVVTWVPDLVALDSVGELLPLVGANSNDPDDLSAANRRYVQPVADAGSGVVLLDHMAKYAGDGDGPTGTDAKGRPIRGASYHARTVREFAPGQGGALRLALDKDTTGSVRAVLVDENARRVSGRRVAGVFALVPMGDDPDAWGSLTYRLDSSGPDDAAELASGAEVIDARLADAVVKYVTEHPGESGTEVEDNVKGKRREAIRDALAAADVAGLLTTTRCGRGCAECSRSGKRSHPQRVHYFPCGDADTATDDPAEVAG